MKTVTADGGGWEDLFERMMAFSLYIINMHIIKLFADFLYPMFIVII